MGTAALAVRAAQARHSIESELWAGGFPRPHLLGDNTVRTKPLKVTLELINQMQADGVIETYAIGGAVGAIFYLAPAATVDVYVFVILPGRTGLLLSLSPIYQYLKSHGGKEQDEYIVLGGWPVQFLPCSNELEREALRGAVSTKVEGVPTWVMPAEHLVAIALNTGRAKRPYSHSAFHRTACGRPSKAR